MPKFTSIEELETLIAEYKRKKVNIVGNLRANFRVDSLAELVNVGFSESEVHIPDNLLPDFGRVTLYSVRQRHYWPTAEKDQFAKWGELVNDHNSSTVFLLTDPPHEAVENGVTYRIVNGATYSYSSGVAGVSVHSQLMAVPDTDPRYVLLDKGHYLVITAFNWFAVRKITADVFKIMVLVDKVPELAKLVKTPELSPATAPATLLKMLRKAGEMGPHVKAEIQASVTTINNMMEADAHNLLAQQLAEGKTDKFNLNDIVFTKDSAEYNEVSIKFPNLFTKVLKHYTTASFLSGDADIYSLIRLVAGTVAESVRSTWTAPAIEINGITVTAGHNGSRYTVNGKAVRLDEMVDVISHAGCLYDQETYDSFVRSVSKQSLAIHKALSQGVGLKIHDSMSVADSRLSEAKPEAPKLHFRKLGREYRLIVNDELEVKVTMGSLVQSLVSINRKVPRYAPISELAEGNRARVREAVARCSRGVYTKTKDTDWVFEIRKPTEAELVAVTAKAIEYSAKALEKSVKFVEAAVKATGAEKIDWNHRHGYKVKGTRRTYFVEIGTNKVYDMDTSYSVCIVEKSAHVIDTSNDALATRLYLLKNDAVSKDMISTL